MAEDSAESKGSPRLGSALGIYTTFSSFIWIVGNINIFEVTYGKYKFPY